MQLLERETQLEILLNGFSKATQGEGRSFFILGEAGTGKTSLIRHFAEQVKSQSSVFVSFCDSLYTPRPLGPVYDLAYKINRELASNLSSFTSRTDLFAAVYDAFTSTNVPSIFIIEDVHWADEATLDFIKFFSRRINHSSSLLLMSCREFEASCNHPLRNVMGELPRDSFSRISLPAFSRATVEKLARERGYSGENLYEITGGNPFYVTEMLASYREEIPDNIKDAVLALFNPLVGKTRDIWEMLSIMPEGMETNILATLDTDWELVLDKCVTHGILLIRNDKVVYKHELFRRTIESSISPLRRIQLNKKILESFLDRFIREGAIERIVHYATNAGDNSLVAKYAPQAAKQAASLAAHTQAAKLYKTAIDFNEDKNPETLISLYESYSYECYLTNQIEDAIIYTGKALRLHQTMGNNTRIGNSIRFLSRLWWFFGNRKESIRYAMEAIQLFENEPNSPEKAMAYSNLSQLKMLSAEFEDTLYWGNQAIEMGRELNNPDILSHALNNVGAAQMVKPGHEEEGFKNLQESLELALQHDAQEHAARAYTNIIANFTSTRQYEKAETYLAKGIQYCLDKDLHSWMRYKLGWKARLLLETGRLAEAKTVAESLLEFPDLTSIVKINALFILGTLDTWQDNQAGIALLNEAKQLAFITEEAQRILPVALALSQYEWLNNQCVMSEAEIATAVSMLRHTGLNDQTLQTVYWLKKSRPDHLDINQLYQQFEQERNHSKIADGYFEKMFGCALEKAILLFEGSDTEKKQSITLLENMQAKAVIRKLKEELRESGQSKIPRGMRNSTRNNPAQLTTRELDILQLLKTGAANKEIASSLFISPKTVDHHISSILFKLDVSSRVKAVGEAERLGILK